MKYIFFSCLLVVSCLDLSAQEIINHASTGSSEEKYDIIMTPPADFPIPDGTIVSYQKEQLMPISVASSENPELMHGVFDMSKVPAYNRTVKPVETPSVLHSKDPMVISDGIAYVKYNLQNGAIIKGDYITISSQPGTGMKAVDDGFTIGVALENSDDTEKQGLIKLRVMVRYEKLK